METKPHHIVVIGGGITGLSAAYYLQKLMKEAQLNCRLTVVEKSDTFGGKIETLRRDGFIIEKGPESFLARKLPMMELARELGLEEQLVGTNPDSRKTYILSHGKLHRLPPGLMLGIPTEVGPFLRTGLLSPAGKARAALDLILPKSSTTEDESLGHFLERRLGTEVLTRVAEPLLSGIYGGDAYSLSVRATFPQFHTIEQKYRSVILGMMKNRKAGGEESRTLPEIAHNSMFLSFKEGLETIIHGLIDALENVRVVKQSTITGIERTGAGYRLLSHDGEIEEADGVVVTLPAYAAATVLESAVPEMAELRKLNYSSVANLYLAYDASDIKREWDGSGFIVPRTEGRFITASTWTSYKWPHTAPDGKALLRCFFGRLDDERWMGMSEDEIVWAVRKDVKETMGITAEPLFTEFTPLVNSMPQYPVGHLDSIKRIRDGLQRKFPHVILTGAAFQGVGLPDCVRQAKEAAQELVNRFQKGISQ